MDKPTEEQLRDPKWWDENAPDGAEFSVNGNFYKTSKNLDY